MSNLITFANPIPQHFSFSKPIMRYLLDNTKPSQLIKLYKTCKYFYAYLQLDIVKGLCISEYDVDIDYELSENPNIIEIEDDDDDEEEEEEDCNDDELVSIRTDQLNLLKKKIWLTGFISLGGTLNVQDFFSKVSRCDIKELYLSMDNKLEFNEFKFLTASKKVERASICIKIYFEDDTVVPLEDILRQMPNLKNIIVGSCHITIHTMTNLLKLKHQRKFEYFSLYDINLLFDPELMNRFLKENLENKAVVIVKYKTAEMNKHFIPKLYEKLIAWKDKQITLCPAFFP